MKCARCNKREISMGQGYPLHFAMGWGRLTITLSRASLCDICIDKLFSKIKKALMNDGCPKEMKNENSC